MYRRQSQARRAREKKEASVVKNTNRSTKCAGQTTGEGGIDDSLHEGIHPSIGEGERLTSFLPARENKKKNSVSAVSRSGGGGNDGISAEEKNGLTDGPEPTRTNARGKSRNHA